MTDSSPRSYCPAILPRSNCCPARPLLRRSAAVLLGEALHPVALGSCGSEQGHHVPSGSPVTSTCPLRSLTAARLSEEFAGGTRP